MLSEMQKDLLKEMVNVYIGQAASFLSEMVNQKIILCIPEIQLVNVEEIGGSIYRTGVLSGYSHLVSSSMKFGNQFKGKAYLVFPAHQAKNIVNACMGEDVVSEQELPISLQDTDFDVLKEISNVILNAIIGEMGNFLCMKLEYSLPEIDVIYLEEPENQIKSQQDMYVLVLHTKFELAETSVVGTVVIALGMNSISILIDKLNNELGEL